MEREKASCLGALISLAFISVVLFGEINNIVELIKCDFKAPYKAEVVRMIGVFVPPVGMIVGWVTIEDR